MKRPINIAIALGVLGLLVGMGVGWLGSRMTSSREASSVSDVPEIAMAPALEAALAEGATSTRLLRLVEALEHLDASNRDSMVAIIEREKSVLSDLELRVIFDAWARLEPESATLYPGNEKWAVSKRKVAMGAAVESWALRDPLAARRLVDLRLANAPKLAPHLVHPFIVGWTASGVPGVVEYIRQLPKHLHPAATVAMVTTLARMVGVEQLLRWADDEVGVGEARFQRDFFGRVVKAATRRDPAATAAWVLVHIDQEYAVDGPSQVAPLWFPREPDEAFDWIANRVPEKFRAGAAAAAARDWLATDFRLLGHWLESQPLVPLHDPMLKDYARALAVRGSDEALGWAERIFDEDQRMESLKTVARLWHQREPEAALAWLETSPLDEAAREAIRNAPKRPRPGSRVRRPPPSAD